MSGHAVKKLEPKGHSTWESKSTLELELSCPLGTTRCIPQEKFPGSRIINPLQIKLVRSRWLDTGLVLFFFFFASLWTETKSRSIKTQEEITLLGNIKFPQILVGKGTLFPVALRMRSATRVLFQLYFIEIKKKISETFFWLALSCDQVDENLKQNSILLNFVWLHSSVAMIILHFY